MGVDQDHNSILSCLQNPGCFPQILEYICQVPFFAEDIRVRQEYELPDSHTPDHAAHAVHAHPGTE